MRKRLSFHLYWCENDNSELSNCIMQFSFLMINKYDWQKAAPTEAQGFAV